MIPFQYSNHIMIEVIEYLSKLQKEQVIDGYALAGGTALLFYTEPLLTYDVDIFILYSVDKHGLIDLHPLYRIAEEMGYKAQDEHIMIGSIPVQLIPAPGDLEVEAVEKAQLKNYGERQIKVLSLEYLMAIMVRNGRSKDRERIKKILSDDVEFDQVELEQILKKYDLKDKWENLRVKEI